MKNLITFSGLEEIIRTAIKLSKYSVKDIAENVFMSNSGMYCFTNRHNHISVSKGDEILLFLKEHDIMALQTAIDIYLNN